MKLLRSFHVMAFALVLVSIAGLCIAQHSVELLLVAGALAAMSWYVTEGPRGRYLPRWVSTLLVIAVSLNVFVELLPDREDWVQVLGRFAVWMTIIKLYERKSPRDYGQLLLLSLLLMLTGTVQSSELVFGIVLLIYTALGVYVLLLFQLHSAHEHAKSERRGTTPRDYRLAPPVKTVFGPGLAGHFRSLTAFVAILGLGLSILLFLIFPRGLGEGVVPALARTGSPRGSGFAETIELGGGTRITDSRRSVMIVRLLDGRGRRIRFGQPIYLRGATMSLYHSGRWSGPPREETRRIDAGPDRFSPIAPLIEPAQSYTLEIDPFGAQTVLFAMAEPVAVSTAAPGIVLFDPRTHLLYRDGGSSRDAYALRAQPVPTAATLSELSGGRVAGSGAVTMPQNRRIAELSRGLLDDADLAMYAPPDADERFRWNMAAARVFARHLQSPQFTYVTDLSDVVVPSREEIDPIEWFLFQTRRGHCEYYASALAAMCHAVRVPVRVVTGYLAYEYDDEREHYTVLESNAHAWVEVRSGEYRWATVDPTPGETVRELHRGEASLADRLSWIYQRFEGSWDSAVASFDASSQGEMVSRLDLGWADRLGRVVQDARQWLSDVNRAFYFGAAGYVWMGVVAFAGLLALAVLVRIMRRTRRLRRRLRLERVGGAEFTRLLRLGFYLDMLDVLERGRLGKPTWRPPRLHARALGVEHAEVSSIVRRVTDLFYAARYGGHALAPDELRRARSLVGELARLLKVKRP